MNLNPAEFTLRTLVHQNGHSLGCFTVWKHKEDKRGVGYLSGMDDGIKSMCVRVLREILREHPEFKRDAAKWIRAGIQAAK